jgi:hypothetical protein
MPRAMTNKLLEMMDEGTLDPRLLAESALRYMSEDDVADMARCEGLVDEDTGCGEDCCGASCLCRIR